MPFCTPSEMTSTFASVNNAKPSNVIHGVLIIFPNNSLGLTVESITAPDTPRPL